MRAVGAASTPGLHYSITNQYELKKMEIANLLTCPPEKPTATTPSSLPEDKNLGLMRGGEVMVC
jgi:hypothetical protein